VGLDVKRREQKRFLMSPIMWRFGSIFLITEICFNNTVSIQERK